MKFKESKLAHTYLDGLEGLEIGASAHNPFGLNTKNVDYTEDIDVFKQEQIRLCGESAKVDIIASGDDIPVDDKSHDFVISSHAIEHFVDPIKTLKEWKRIATKYIFIVIPNKERTFDKDRKVTDLRDLLDRHSMNLTHEDIVDPNYKYFNGVSPRYGHYNVWDTPSFLRLLKNMEFNVVSYKNIDDKVGNGSTFVIKL